MKTDENNRKRIVEILSKGLSRCVDVNYKSRNISILSENKFSNNVSKELGFPKDKSVSMVHED